MTLIGWIQILVFCTLVVALAKPLGGYITRVFNGERNFLSPILLPLERGLYGLAGIDAKREQHWLTYTIAMLLFNAIGFVGLYVLMRLQASLPRRSRASKLRGSRRSVSGSHSSSSTPFRMPVMSPARRATKVSSP